MTDACTGISEEVQNHSDDLLKSGEQIAEIGSLLQQTKVLDNEAHRENPPPKLSEKRSLDLGTKDKTEAANQSTELVRLDYESPSSSLTTNKGYDNSGRRTIECEAIEYSGAQDWNNINLDARSLYSGDENMKAKRYVGEGNKLLNEQNIEEANEKFKKAIETSPYYSIAYYNIRNANNALELKEKIKKCAASVGFVSISSAVVLDHDLSEDGYSSDEEKLNKKYKKKWNETYDNCFKMEYEKYKKEKKAPFTIRLKNTVHKTEKKIIPHGENSLNQQSGNSSSLGIVGTFLSKINENGFERSEEGNMEEKSCLSVSMALNRMHSLSTRKNKLLTLELERNVSTTDIKYEKFGYYWTCQWETNDGKEVGFEKVRRFYKNLKKKDPDLAKEFLKLEENFEKNKSNIPYQIIREYGKNHDKTKKLVKEMREMKFENIYLHFVDEDVFDFNGVYSAYLRVVEGCYKLPTVMSTGYEFPLDPQGKAHRLLSHMERMHRVITSLYVPLGVYYSETNLCILIPKKCETVPESFLDSNRGSGKTLESAILLTAISTYRKDVCAIFSEDSPIFTAIPQKAMSGFSREFNYGPASPKQSDIKKYYSTKMPYTHCQTLKWSKNLFINKAIKYNKIDVNNAPVIYSRFHNLIPKIRKGNEVENSVSELNKSLKDTKDVTAIKNACQELIKYEETFNKMFERTKEEQKLIDIIDEHCKDLMKIPRDFLLIIGASPIMHFIKKNISYLDGLLKLELEMLAGIMQTLHSKKFDPNYVEAILNILLNNFKDFEKDYSQFDVQEIIENLKNPLN